MIEVLGEGGHNLLWNGEQQHLLLHREGQGDPAPSALTREATTFGNPTSAITVVDILIRSTILSTVSGTMLHPVIPGRMVCMLYNAR